MYFSMTPPSFLALFNSGNCYFNFNYIREILDIPVLMGAEPISTKQV